MSCATPLCVFKPALIVAGLAALGMAGYNLATTGCPLGSCSGEQAKVSAAAMPVGEDECPMGGCCPEEASQPAVLASTPVAAYGGCPMTAGDSAEGCPMAGAADCEGKDVAACETDCGACELDCETECPHGTPAGQVAGGAEEKKAETASDAG